MLKMGLSPDAWERPTIHTAEVRDGMKGCVMGATVTIIQRQRNQRSQKWTQAES